MWHKKLAFILIFILGSFFSTGCGSSDGGLSDWQKPAAVTVVSNIEGKVLPPVAGANMRSQAILVSVAGTRVYIEEKPEFYAIADESGKFVIANVPVGKYHLVADLVSGISTYRQRSDQINLTGEFATLILSAPVQLVNAPYKVRINISDLQTGSPIAGSKIKVWGREYYPAATGDIELGPFPKGIWPVEVSAAGYGASTFLVGFDSQKHGQLYLKMTPLTAVDKNRAPIVAIEQGFSTIKTNEQGMLSASGFDPDGDYISYTWSATKGYFSQSSGISTVYTAPPEATSVEIKLKAKDSHGAEAMCVLNLDVLSGSSIPINPDNRPPLAAANPIPANLATNMGSEVMLRWTASDPDGDAMTYDVFFAERGTELALKAENIGQTSYQLVNLKANTTYLWMIIARDVYGAISTSPLIWQFTTGDQSNHSPYQPSNPFPEDLAIDQLPELQFTWTGGDPDLDDIVTYSFMFGQDSANLSVATQTRNTYFVMKDLELGKTFYWKIVASDNRGKETQGPIWRFSTYSPPNQPPTDPVLQYPASGATNLAVDVQMRWESTDPDGDAITYDVFLGKEFPLKKVSENFTAPVYSPSPYLDNATRYYLQVVARDAGGLTNINSPIWSFTTAEKVNSSPNVPEAVFPKNNAINVPLKPVFSWTGGDPDGDAVTYDLYVDTVSPPVNVAAVGLAVESYSYPVDLEKGKKYYWKVLARDSAQHEVSSAIFNFFAVTDTDLQPPEIISVTPADNAFDVAADAEVRVIFNEPVQQAIAIGAFSFVPEIEGTWVWETDTTARFWPKVPWLPGSYHKFVIANNVVKDIAGNLMLSGGTYHFTVKSDVRVPRNYKSSGFPVTVVPGDTYKVAIPELSSGSRSYAVAVASNNATNFTVKSNRLGNWYTDAPEAAFREFEQKLSYAGFPEVMMKKSSLRASLRASQSVGDEKDFYIPAYGSIATSTAYPNNVIRAKCYGATSNVYVYVDNSITSPSSTLISEVRKKFEEGILPKVRDVFGQEPDVGPDGDARLTILLTDSMSDGIAGIFYGADLYANDPADMQLKESNARKMFYVKYSLESDITRYGTLAHEFQHMVNFWQKRINGGQGVFEATWLNEGLSKYSEEVCGYGILNGDQNTALLIKLSQENFGNLSVTEWTGLNSYGLSYLFVRFLAQENRYGTTYREITRKLVQSNLTGIQNVEAVTGESFSQTLARWAISLYLNDYSSTDPLDYGLTGLNLAGNYAGVTLPGFVPVSLAEGNSQNVSLPANGVRGFVRVSTGAASTDFEFSGFNTSMKLWLFDQR
ncbi:MAG: hypothetical protein Kow0029_05900 [Candidatus Rifleibacteriota bacterium]